MSGRKSAQRWTVPEIYEGPPRYGREWEPRQLPRGVYRTAELALARARAECERAVKSGRLPPPATHDAPRAIRFFVLAERREGDKVVELRNAMHYAVWSDASRRWLLRDA